MKLGIGVSGLTLYFTKDEHTLLSQQGYGTHLTCVAHDADHGWIFVIKPGHAGVVGSNMILENTVTAFPYRCQLGKKAFETLKHQPGMCTNVNVKPIWRDRHFTIGLTYEEVANAKLTPLERKPKVKQQAPQAGIFVPNPQPVATNGAISLDDFRTAVNTVNTFLQKYRGHVVLSLDNNRVKFLIEG